MPKMREGLSGLWRRGRRKSLGGLLSPVGCRKTGAVLAVITIGGRERHLPGMEAVSGHIGLELGPCARLTGVRTVVVDSTTKFAHGNDSGSVFKHRGQLALWSGSLRA
jgi:hypothetical protein